LNYFTFVKNHIKIILHFHKVPFLVITDILTNKKFVLEIALKVLGRNKLADFSKKHTQAKKALDIWFDEVSNANWQTPQDIKNRYFSADFLSDNRVIFDIKGNHYRLMVKVRYQSGIVIVEWVGTHAEYDKRSFK
jgi:mRNA interferase HigB